MILYVTCLTDEMLTDLVTAQFALYSYSPSATKTVLGAYGWLIDF